MKIEIKRKVLSEVLKFGITFKTFGENVRYVEVEDAGIIKEFVWDDNIIGLFYQFAQFTDYIFGGEQEDGLYHFYKKDGTSYSNSGFTDYQIIWKRQIKKKCHNKLKGCDETIFANENGEWYSIFPDGTIISEDEVWKDG